MSYDFEKVKAGVRLIIEGIGDDPEREGVIETPDRVAKMYAKTLNGYGRDPKDDAKTFTAESGDMVTIKGMPFYSTCEHHMQPFFGVFHFAYVPNKTIIGLSKPLRMARIYMARLQVQERLTMQLADMFQEVLCPHGVAVQLNATHMCMALRGVRCSGASTTTTAVRGLFKDDSKAREEFLETIKHTPQVFAY